MEKQKLEIGKSEIWKNRRKPYQGTKSLIRRGSVTVGVVIEGNGNRLTAGPNRTMGDAVPVPGLALPPSPYSDGWRGGSVASCRLLGAPSRDRLPDPSQALASKH